jgi:ferrous iron transport protein B
MSHAFRIALAGNPNAGKSTLFNALTGGQQRVGNWPGKTVARKEGQFSINGTSVRVIDLPGTYSLSAYSIEEIITRDYVIHECPNVVVAVVDAANLERNLYLIVQLIELGVPLIVALNMADVAETRGVKVDVGRLSAGLGVPVLTTIATQGRGLDDLKACIAELIRDPGRHDPRPALSNGEKCIDDPCRCPKCG